MNKQQTIRAILDAATEGNLSKAEDALDGYASVQCAECENSRNNLIIDLAHKEEAIKELVEGLRSNDETLSYLEDFTHGYEGHKITQQRGENQKLIQKHKP